MATTERSLEFVYVGDPMCSWCWGFAPVLDALQENFTIPIRVIAGGLRPGPAAEPLDDRMRATLAHHWEQVAERSGQPFDHSFLQREDGWVYDTEMPDIAVVTMRHLRPFSTLPFFARLQQAFYAEGVDITDPGAYPDLVDGFEVDRDHFVELLNSPEMKEKTWQDFAEARRLGVTGFPALLLDEGDRMVSAGAGYVPAEALIPAVRDWVLEHHTALAPGLVCDLDGEVC
jgi:putative protein-disulfide isomerase